MGGINTEPFMTMLLASLLLERCLATLFEWKPIQYCLNNWGWTKRIQLKVIIAVLVAFFICQDFQYNAFNVLFSEKEGSSLFSQILTALAIAGGSKGFILLFQDKWKIGSKK